jgi:predicted O-linked N-acetylglucosamine transferase (SPINDLY family)
MTQLADHRGTSVISPSIGAAARHHQAGRLADAEIMYRELLAGDPDQPEVLHLLGALCAQNDRMDSAIELISRAISLKPEAAIFYETLARSLKSSGRLNEAIAAYRQALHLKPDFASAQNNLGVALCAAGDLSESQSVFRAAIKTNPEFAEAHNNLGHVLIEAGRFDDAITACRRATALKADYGDAFNNLGNALKGKRLINDALAAYRRALQINPAHAEAWNNLGIALYEARAPEDSIAAFRQSLQLRPGYAEAHNNLANAWRSLGRLADALASYRMALDIKPAYAEAHNNLGVVLWETGSHEQAIASCQKALQLKPDFSEAHNSLANILKDRGDFDQAIAHYESALELNSEYAEAHSNLAVALKDQARFDEAIDHARRAIAIRPDHKAHGNLIYLLHFHPDADRSAIQREQADWHRLHAEPLASGIAPHENVRNPERRLRIGYISPCFRRHVVGLNILPLLREHCHEQFEIFCYSDVVQTDSLTQQFKSYADCCRNIVGLADDRVAELIRQDKIDILIDLSLHLSGNRLLVLARRPAPVQMSFAGYPGSTGLRTVDYRITDPYLDPPMAEDAPPFERPLRLPSFWCYDESAMTAGMDEIPQISPLPAESVGHITFGCLNNFCKVNDRVLQLWARVLRAVPESHLLLLAPAGLTRRRTANRFAQLGVATDRIEFVGHRTRKDYSQLYNRIDVGLDTFPYNGHTTSLDSLWMGVPVVTLGGAAAVGRAGISQLSNLGLTSLIARTPDEFVRIAGDLAGNIDHLGALRSGLRTTMRQSPIMNAKRFAGSIETIYRTSWANWCREIAA